MKDVLPRPGSCSASEVRSALVDYLERTGGCALCKLLARLEFDHVVQFATAKRGDLQGFRDFSAGMVLCNGHFWQVDRSFDSPHFADRLLEFLALLPGDLGLGDGSPASLEGLPLRRERCWICQELARDQGDYVGALVGLLEDPEFRGAYQRSRGLCLPHVHAVATAAGPEARAWLLGAELAHWQSLKHDLAELWRKRGPGVRAGLTAAEEVAPARCVQKLVRGSGCPWPTEPQPNVQRNAEDVTPSAWPGAEVASGR
jgi:hypothetical protein